MTTTEITDVTRTCQNPFTTAALVAALETAWAAIRDRHAEVPAAVIVVGAGTTGKASQYMKYGHFANLRWQHGDQQLPEVLVSGEGLSRTPEEVFTTLLHEAAHGLAAARDIQDTSRQGRWHNAKFAKLAAELGLTARKDDKLGYSPCTLNDDTTAHYKAIIGRLGEALGAFRHPEPVGVAKGRTNNNNPIPCECSCPRKIRIAATVLDEGPVGCGICRTWFLPEDTDRDDYTVANPFPGTETDAGDGTGLSEEEDEMVVFYDPTGAKYGIPTYPYKMAPEGLATVRQLRKRGLRPGGQDIAAQILWRRGKRCAYLYRINLAVPKRTATPAQQAAIERALLARRTCPKCTQVRDYYIPRRTGACLTCEPEVNS
jgi:hypothetical protein